MNTEENSPLTGIDLFKSEQFKSFLSFLGINPEESITALSIELPGPDDPAIISISRYVNDLNDPSRPVEAMSSYNLVKINEQ